MLAIAYLRLLVRQEEPVRVVRELEHRRQRIPDAGTAARAVDRPA